MSDDDKQDEFLSEVESIEQALTRQGESEIQSDRLRPQACRLGRGQGLKESRCVRTGMRYSSIHLSPSGESACANRIEYGTSRPMSASSNDERR